MNVIKIMAVCTKPRLNNNSFFIQNDTWQEWRLRTHRMISPGFLHIRWQPTQMPHPPVFSLYHTLDNAEKPS